MSAHGACAVQLLAASQRRRVTVAARSVTRATSESKAERLDRERRPSAERSSCQIVMR